MNKFLIALVTFMAVNTHARPLNCIVSFMNGSELQDFQANKTAASNGDFTQYALVNKNGFSFYANESVSSKVLNTIIIDGDKTHLGTSPILAKGERSCLTVSLGRNADGGEIKVSISCEAL
jgi:hypothetical protein